MHFLQKITITQIKIIWSFGCCLLASPSHCASWKGKTFHVDNGCCWEWCLIRARAWDYCAKEVKSKNRSWESLRVWKEPTRETQTPTCSQFKTPILDNIKFVFQSNFTLQLFIFFCFFLCILFAFYCKKGKKIAQNQNLVLLLKLFFCGVFMRFYGFFLIFVVPI